uniref:Immunoglobulin V-set domain-containing protein n=1 Tax=Astatotilapia calliptera TaxID=8154 RepID=A0AAX7TB80_ASTCA
MLVTLCALITALTCVSGVTVLTQKPPVLSVRKGETATMDCNLGTGTNAAAWHKQIPGGSPQYVLRFHRSYSSSYYGSGFSSPKFTSTHQSTTDYRLIIVTAVAIRTLCGLFVLCLFTVLKTLYRYLP